MIDPKVIKAIAFGAGCLLGIRSATIKQLSTATPAQYLQELAVHIAALFTARGYAINFERAFDLGHHAPKHTQEKLKVFLNTIFCLYCDTRGDIHEICQHFANEEVSYANFAQMKDQQAARNFLMACKECMYLLEQLLGANDYASKATLNYLEVNTEISPEAFDLLLKDVIILRLGDYKKTPAARPKVPIF